MPKKLLLDLIKSDGNVEGEIINVERFINHKINFNLYDKISDKFLKEFPYSTFDKIMTVESSGIALGSFISAKCNKDLIFLKKKKPITMKNYYSEKSYSFTKQVQTELFLSKEVLNSGEKILFVDDFYAQGNTFKAAKSLIEKAKCVLSGFGVIIDKSNSDEIFSIIKLKDIV